MKVRILVASALLDDGKDGGLYEEHEVSDKRGAYLVSVDAAEELKPAKKAEKKADDDGSEKKAPAEKKAAPARRPAPRKTS